MRANLMKMSGPCLAIGKDFCGRLVTKPRFAVSLSVAVSLMVWGLPVASAQQANSFEPLQVLGETWRQGGCDRHRWIHHPGQD
jgi:hypothetical protein